VNLGYLGLGSNIGDRQAWLEAAVAGLTGLGVEAVASSSVYETQPVGLVLDQPEFLNACLRVRTAAGPEALLDMCKEVERAVGREPSGARHGPRTIDVDVLLLDGVSYSSQRLTVPHPEVTTRRFVLVPLLELNPKLRLPSGVLLADALAALPPGQAVRRIAPPLAL
jgi:2-amino-4-hydroxy-6-hydroxymethyldihydropteridine diphosphokinase